MLIFLKQKFIRIFQNLDTAAMRSTVFYGEKLERQSLVAKTLPGYLSIIGAALSYSAQFPGERCGIGGVIVAVQVNFVEDAINIDTGQGDV